MTKQDPDNVGTPPSLIRDIVTRTGREFTIDLAASDRYHVADRYFSKDGFVLGNQRYAADVFRDWDAWIVPGDYFWLNPPYSRKAKMERWLELAIDVAKACTGGVILVVANIASSKAFQDYIGGSEQERLKNGAKLYFPDGRQKFLTDAKTTVYPYASMAIILQGGHPK